MKVLKKVDYTDWRHKLMCSRCTSELEVEPSDVQAQYHECDNDPRSYSPAYYTYHIICAVCKTQLSILSGEIPKAMQHFLQEKAPGTKANFFDQR